VEVLNADLLHGHCERSLTVIHQTTGPLNGALSRIFRAGGPVTDLDLTGRLGIVLAVDGHLIGVRHGANLNAIDPPLEIVLIPVGGIVVEFRVGILDGVEAATVEGGVVALTEEVTLHLAGVVSDPFPIDLVQVVRLQHHTADDTCALGHLHPRLDHAEEDIEVGLEQGGLAFLREGKLGSLGGGGVITRGHVPDGTVEGGIEVPLMLRTQRRVGGTGLVERVAGGVCLSEGIAGQSGQHGEVGKGSHTVITRPQAP